MIAPPSPGEATTHIVKPEIPRFAGSVANDASCMALTRTVGLDVAEGVACEVDGRPYLLVTRYDRARRNGVTVRLHQ